MITSSVSTVTQRLGLGVLALVAALALGLAASGAAFAQAPTPPAEPAPPPAGPVGTLEVSLDTDDDQVDEGDSVELEVTVRNTGAGPVSGATLEINVEDEFDIESVTDGGPKTQTDNGDETRVYTLGPLQPGQELSFTVHGEFEDIDRGDDGDDFDISAEVTNGAQTSSDTEEIEVESEERRGND